MNNGNLNKALNHATILKLANYSRVRVRKVPNLVDLVEFEDLKNFSWELARMFNTTDTDIFKIRNSFVKSFQKFQEYYKILFIKDKAYPEPLRRIQEPPPFLFCRGNIDLFNGKGIAVVGSRKASELGIKRARKLAALLVAKGYVVVSGLAKGIDATGHTGAIHASGKTIAVIGTPLDKSYPKENIELQEYIAQKHLLVSQFHFGHPVNRYSFPTRNYTMSGISDATVIVEASETSGALIQARQCMAQGRHLFLLKNLLDRTDLKWPKKYVKKGAYVISEIEDVPKALQEVPNYQNNDSRELQMF